MKKTVVIYCSKTGFSEKYARWLAEELGCRAVHYGKRRGVELAAFDTVILIGGLYAGNMAGFGWLKKQLPHLAGKRIAAVAVGCAPVDTPSLPESMEKLFGGTPEIRGFYCQGGLAYDRMSPVHRMMMAALRASLRGKPESAAMLEGIARSFDGTRRENLEEVIAWAEGKSKI